MRHALQLQKLYLRFGASFCALIDDMPPKKGRKMVPKTEGGDAAEGKKKGKKKSKEKTGESCASCPSSAPYLSYYLR